MFLKLWNSQIKLRQPETDYTGHLLNWDKVKSFAHLVKTAKQTVDGIFISLLSCSFICRYWSQNSLSLELLLELSSSNLFAPLEIQSTLSAAALRWKPSESSVPLKDKLLIRRFGVYSNTSNWWFDLNAKINLAYWQR